MITASLLRQIMPQAGERAETFADPLEAARRRWVGDDPAHVAMWLAQLAHESGELRYVREIASGEAYEGRTDLGNTQPGDGTRFRGRGLIQLTGRHNYTRAAQALGLPLLDQPELLEQPENAAAVSGWFWNWQRIGELMSAADPVLAVTKRINGGTNGLAQRRGYFARAASLMPATSPGPEVEPAPIERNDTEAAPPTFWERNVSPFLAAALPQLVKMIPELIRNFGSDGRVTERNAKAAEALLTTVQAATGATNAQDAIERLASDQKLLSEVRSKLEAESWFELTEAGGDGIAGARKAATEIGERFWQSGVFWVTALLLPLLYGTVYLVLTGPEGAFSSELRAAIASSVVTGVLGGIIGYWLGLKFRTSRPTADN